MTKIAAAALAGVLALGSLTGCNWGSGDDCDASGLAAASVLERPGPGGGGGGAKGGSKGGGSKGNKSKTSKGKTGGGSTTHVYTDDCDDDD